MRRLSLGAACAALVILSVPVFCQGIPGLRYSMSLTVLPAAGHGSGLEPLQAADMGLGQAFQRLQAAAPTPSAPGQNAKIPEPYKKEEFPQWLQDLWRAEVIFIGSLPFTYFYTLESYDIYRYVKSGFSFSEVPWPFRPGSEIGYTPTEQLWLIATSVGLSVLITGVDYLLDQLTRARSSPAQ